MIRLIWDKRFKRRFSKYIQKHPDKYEKIKKKLKKFQEAPFSPELRNHKLSGKLKDLRAIVIEYDCRIVFKFIEKDTAALLITVGPHDVVY